LESFFYSIYRYFQTHKVLFALLIPAVFALLAYWASRIRFEEDITRLIPAGEEAEQVTRVMNTVRFTDKVVINIATPHEDSLSALQEYADAFGAAVTAKASPYVERVQIRLEDDQLIELMDLVNRNLPLFLDSDDYRRMDSLLSADSITAKVAAVYEAVTAPQGLVTPAFARQDPLGLTYMGLRKFQRLQSAERFVLADGYLVAPGGKNLLAFITTRSGAGETEQNSHFIHILDSTVHALNVQFEGRVTGEYFGAVPMAVANAKQIKRDIQVTLSIALVVLLALFIYFYRRVSVPFIILVPAAFGSLLGMGVLYWYKGTISAISIGIGSVLLGLTLDYSLHILSHQRSTGDIKRLFAGTVRPLLICAVFTAVDFLCLLFLRSDVLKDLGLFAAVSVLGAAVFSLVFIPQVYKPDQTTAVRQNTFIDRVARYDLSRNKWVLGGALLVTLISLLTFQRVGFNNDLEALNYRPERLKQAEQRLDSLNNFGAKSIYLVAYGDTYEQALGRNAVLYERLGRAEEEGKILNFQSIGGIAQTAVQQQEKIARWNRYWSDGRREQLIRQLTAEGEKAGFKANAFEPFFETLRHPFLPMDDADQAMLDTLFFREFVATGDNLSTIMTMVKLPDGVDPLLLASTVEDGDGVLSIDRKRLQERLLSNLEADFNNLFFIASIAVFAVIFLFFGSLEITLITNIPIFLGWLVTLGLMGMFNIQFNAFNIIITTLIFGLGVDYAIFVTKGLLEQYTYGTDDLPAYKSGVIMSALATLLCFGILVFAKHPAIRSISVIPLIGLLVVVLMSFSIQPWLFRTFISGPQDRGNTPWRIVNLILTGLTFGYFFLGGLALSLGAQLLIPLIPVSRDRKLKAFHKVLQLFFHNLMYRTPGVRMEVLGRDAETYAKPAIIIANHTSILDTPTMGLLQAKQLFMMNERQLRSPFFGRAMRMVGAHPATENHPYHLDRLREKIRQGYSLIVFPEGTRSTTTRIGRFHKGAFYLAEQLKLDIIPVLVHGNAHALPKHDNMLKPGPISMKFLPRIRHDDPSFGLTYSERAKTIGAYFRHEFRMLRNEKEPPGYFEKKLLFNFLYKPKRIQRQVKADFRANAARYHWLLRQLPGDARILHLGCGYGVLDYLLVYDSAGRSVTAWDADAATILAARHTYTVNRYPLRFVTSPPASGAYDAVIISRAQTGPMCCVNEHTRWIVLEDVQTEELPILAQKDFQLVAAESGIKVWRKNERII
jgi:Predicted exporter